jgi:hypothetical protein
MTKKNILLIAVLVAMVSAYAIWFADWFKPATIQIFHVNRNRNTRVFSSGVMPGLIFGLNRPLQLTEVKVVPLAGYQTNANILPVWHVVSDSNSVPLKAFFYGQNLRGLRPAIKGTHVQPLDSNVVYRLFITDGKFKGEHDFQLGAK